MSEKSSPKHARAVLAACILGSSLAFVDGSVVNVSLPAIGRGLQASAASLSWVISGYLLWLSACIMLGGALGDRFGRRKLFIFGTALFITASLVCAAAPTLAALVVARMVQGLGAALLMPNSLAILGTNFSGEEKGKAIGTWAGSGALMAAVGPLLGGWLQGATPLGWRAIFIINLPIGAAAMFLAWRFIRECHDRSNAARLDWPGAALVTSGLGLLTWALIDAAEKNATPEYYLGALAAGILLLALFLWVQLHKGERALMPIHLLAGRTFIGVSLLTFMLYGALGGLIVLVPFLLMRIKGFSPTEAGAALMPLPLLAGLGSRLMGQVVSRIGGRWPLTGGATLVALSLLLYLRVTAEPGHYWDEIFPPTLLMGIGMAMTAAPLTTTVIGAVQPQYTGVASGFNSAMARMGGLLATAALAFVMAKDAEPQAFIIGFHSAALIGAVLAGASAVSAALLIANKSQLAKEKVA